eukprot:327041_1
MPEDAGLGLAVIGAAIVLAILITICACCCECGCKCCNESCDDNECCNGNSGGDVDVNVRKSSSFNSTNWVELTVKSENNTKHINTVSPTSFLRETSQFGEFSDKNQEINVIAANNFIIAIVLVFLMFVIGGALFWSFKKRKYYNKKVQKKGATVTVHQSLI